MSVRREISGRFQSRVTCSYIKSCVVKKGHVARVDRRLRQYYLIVRLLPNVFALACLPLSSM